jgi:hypothetical protein
MLVLLGRGSTMNTIKFSNRHDKFLMELPNCEHMVYDECHGFPPQLGVSERTPQGVTKIIQTKQPNQLHTDCAAEGRGGELN